MSVRRRIGIIVLMGVAMAWGIPSASRADAPAKYDGTYNAFLSCDPLPYTQAMRNQPFVLTIKDGQLNYARDVKMPNGVDTTGVSEHAKGTVASDGSVSVSGAAGTTTWSFTSTFQGHFDGTVLHLTGTQSWILPPPQGGGHFKRNCSVTATPQ